MAKKNSPGCGVAIIGLIGLAMAAKYWYVLVAIGTVALLIWGVAKLAKSRSTSAMSELLEPPEKRLNSRKVSATENKTNTPVDINKADKTVEKHFVDNGDGTVTDTSTGLSWMRCALGQTWDGTTCKGTANTYTWDMAKALRHSFAGHNDWRLPTCDELKSIIDPSQNKSTLNAETFSQAASLGFWSSSLHPYYCTRAWCVNFNGGKIFVSNRSNEYSVRLVRGGQIVSLSDQESTAPLVTSAATAAVSCENPNTPSETKTATDLAEINEKAALQERVAQVNAEIARILATEKAAFQERLATNDFVIESGPAAENQTTTPTEIDKADKPIEKYFIDNGDGTVTDTSTGLSWMRCAMGQTWDGTTCKGTANTYTWDKAKALCHSFAGHDDWRLPTCDELKSILDKDKKNPAINIEFFSQTICSWFWTSSPNTQHTYSESFKKVAGFWTSSPNTKHSVWGIDFNSGLVCGIQRHDNISVRLVRGGQDVGLLDQESTEPLVTSAATATVSCENPNTPSETKTATVLAEISEKAALQERVAQVNAEIARILATEKAAAIAASAKSVAAEVALKQKIAEEEGQIDYQFDETLAPVEPQLILDSENIGISERVARQHAEIYQVLENIAVVTADGAAAGKVIVKQQVVEVEKQKDVLYLPSETVTTNISNDPKKQNARCAFCNTIGLHNILRISYTTIDCNCFACGKNFFIFKSDRNEVPTNSQTLASTSQPTYGISSVFSNNVQQPNITTLKILFGASTQQSNSAPLNIVSAPPSELEVSEVVKQYDFVLINKLGQLKTGDQWFEETTQKRRLRTGSDKVYAWLLPFMPFEVAKLCELKNVVAWGLNSVSVISKQLRVLIRERRKIKEPYGDLLRALYSSCVITDFVKTLAFEGPVNKVACNVDIRELHNIHIDYATMGYHFIEALLKTDVKWLVETFGETDTHRSFDALWPTIRQNAVSRYCWEELRISNKMRRSYQGTDTSMVEWLRNRIHSDLQYRREWWKLRQEWLGRNNEWLEEKIAREALPAVKPVTVKPDKYAKTKGYAIPAPPPKTDKKISLDMGSIEAKLAETAAVSAILHNIFTDKETVSSQVALPEPTASEVPIAGLDPESYLFMRMLASKPVWAREELEKLAADHSLLLDGTLDSINDASFDHFGGPFFDGDDPIEIDPEIIRRLEA